MKSFLLSVLLFSFLFLSNQYAQDIKAKLAGHQATNGFTVVDDNDKILLKVTGKGNVGINTDNPSGVLDVNGGVTKSSDGGKVSIIAQSGSATGGEVFIKAGDGGEFPPGDGSRIILGGGKSEGGGTGGDIFILGGHGPTYGGDVNIESGSHTFQLPESPSKPNSNVATGNINIHTGSSNGYGGKLRIYTELDNYGEGGIEIYTEGSEGTSPILIETGRSGYNAGHITLTAGDDFDIIINPNNGLLKLNGSGEYTGSWTGPSDKRYKKNIGQIENSLDKINQLNPVEYEWRKEEYPDKNFQDGKQIGLIAQDVEKIFPLLVSTDSEGYKSIDYSKINVLLIEAMQEQQKSIEELIKEVAELRNKLKDDVSLNIPSNN